MGAHIKESTGYSFLEGLERAKARSAYYEEGILLDTAEQIHKTMLKKKITVSALANKLDLSPGYITKIIQGHKQAGLDTLAKIAFALGMQWECKMVPLKKD